MPEGWFDLMSYLRKFTTSITKSAIIERKEDYDDNYDDNYHFLSFLQTHTHIRIVYTQKQHSKICIHILTLAVFLSLANNLATATITCGSLSQCLRASTDLVEGTEQGEYGCGRDE